MRAIRMFNSTASLALLPARVAGAMLGAPRAAADHPRSRELRALLNDGYKITDYRRPGPSSAAEITLTRGDDIQRVASTDLAFSAFAALAAPRVRGRAKR